MHPSTLAIIHPDQASVVWLLFVSSRASGVHGQQRVNKLLPNGHGSPNHHHLYDYVSQSYYYYYYITIRVNPRTTIGETRTFPDVIGVWMTASNANTNDRRRPCHSHIACRQSATGELDHHPSKWSALIVHCSLFVNTECINKQSFPLRIQNQFCF